MKLLKTGDINTLCRPNAILTFREYIEDYASAHVRKKGLEIISRYMAQIPNDSLRKETESRLKRIIMGERDLYFWDFNYFSWNCEAHKIHAFYEYKYLFVFNRIS